MEFVIQGNGMSIKRNILVVDDEEGFRKLLKKGLSRKYPDYQISEAENGEQALNVLNSGSFDLAILDVNMPEMDGFEVLSYVRKSEEIKNMHVIMCTGSNDKEEVLRIIKMGVSGYIVKSTDTDEMLKKLFGLIDKIFSSDLLIARNSNEQEKLDSIKSANFKLIIADESFELRQLVSKLFSMYYTIYECENMSSLQKICFSEKPDVILFGKTSDTHDLRMMIPRVRQFAKETGAVLVIVYPNKNFKHMEGNNSNINHDISIIRTLNPELLKEQIRRVLKIPGFKFSVSGSSINIVLREGYPGDENSSEELKTKITELLNDNYSGLYFDLSQWENGSEEKAEKEKLLAGLIQDLKKTDKKVYVTGKDFSEDSPLSEYVFKENESKEKTE